MPNNNVPMARDSGDEVSPTKTQEHYFTLPWCQDSAVHEPIHEPFLEHLDHTCPVTGNLCKFKDYFPVLEWIQTICMSAWIPQIVQANNLGCLFSSSRSFPYSTQLQSDTGCSRNFCTVFYFSAALSSLMIRPPNWTCLGFCRLSTQYSQLRMISRLHFGSPPIFAPLLKSLSYNLTRTSVTPTTSN